MRAPPTGPLTFLFSDIEGSTRLWEALPEEMPAALGQHFDILGRVIGEAGGTVVKGTGDGVFAVFGDAHAAVGAAVQAQRGLMTATWGPTGPLRVRMGLHTGTAIHDGGDYHGAWWMVLWELEFGTVEAAMRNGARLDEVAATVPGPIAMAHAAEAAGLLARVRGDLAESRTRLLQAVGLHAQIGNAGCLSHCLEHVALVALDGGDAERAAIVLGTVDAIRDDVVGSAAVPPFERIWHDQATNAARTALGEGSFIAAWERGRAMRLDEAVAMGLAAVGPTSPA